MEELTEALKKVEENILNALKDSKPTQPPKIDIDTQKTNDTDTVDIPTPPKPEPTPASKKEKSFLEKLDTFLFGR